MIGIWFEQINRSFSLAGLQSFLWFFLVVSIVFVPLEVFYAAKKHRWFKEEWGIDFLFFAGQFFIFNGLSVAVLLLLSQTIDALQLQSFQSYINHQPYWIQVLGVIFLCDMGIYWGHRLSHRYEFLWRFHKVHHTSRRLDWMAAYREHPFDNIYTRVIENIPALLLGFPMETIAGFVFFRGLWGLFIHSNVNISLGPLGYVIGSPRLHHWHHDIHRNGSCNFANLSPLMDLLFGTYYNPGEEPAAYGIQEEVNRSYVSQLVEPCLPTYFYKSRERDHEKGE